MPPKRKASGSHPSKRVKTSSSDNASVLPIADVSPKAVLHGEDGFREYQDRACVSYGKQIDDKCSACVAKKVTGCCRFIDTRIFKVTTDSKGKEATNYKKTAFVSLQGMALPSEILKQKRAKGRVSEKPAPPKRAHNKEKVFLSDAYNEGEGESEKVKTAEYILNSIALTLSRGLLLETRHENTNLNPKNGNARPVVRVNAPVFRSVCDMCSTTMFYGWYVCACCGREICLECWDDWVPSDMVDKKIRRIDACSYKRRHIKSNCLFFTHAAPGELKGWLSKVKARASLAIDTSESDKELVKTIPTEKAEWHTKEGPKYLPVPKTSVNKLSSEQFQALWRTGGSPLVLTGCKQRFSLPWNSQYLVKNYGNTRCTVQSWGETYQETVKGFFKGFNDTPNDAKLKDWPPDSTFEDFAPDLFEDFESAVPMQAYTLRNGALNLANCFPPSWDVPDLGPKMYMAFPARDFLPMDDRMPDFQGVPEEGRLPIVRKIMTHPSATTNLHLDITDAINILTETSTSDFADARSFLPKDIPECGAIWDVFPPSARNKINAFLKKRHPDVDDPILRFVGYLSEADLIELKGQGVCSYRIFQQVGDAVWIPAGCCHQVRNRKASIKIAVDFFSPENVEQSRGMMERYRSVAEKSIGSKANMRMDVLQFWTALGFAWKYWEGIASGNGETAKVEGGDVPMKVENGAAEHDPVKNEKVVDGAVAKTDVADGDAIVKIDQSGDTVMGEGGDVGPSQPTTVDTTPKPEPVEEVKPVVAETTPMEIDTKAGIDVPHKDEPMESNDVDPIHKDEPVEPKGDDAIHEDENVKLDGDGVIQKHESVDSNGVDAILKDGPAESDGAIQKHESVEPNGAIDKVEPVEANGVDPIHKEESVESNGDGAIQKLKSVEPNGVDATLKDEPAESNPIHKEESVEPNRDGAVQKHESVDVIDKHEPIEEQEVADAMDIDTKPTVSKLESTSPNRAVDTHKQEPVEDVAVDAKQEPLEEEAVDTKQEPVHENGIDSSDAEGINLLADTLLMAADPDHPTKQDPSLEQTAKQDPESLVKSEQAVVPEQTAEPEHVVLPSTTTDAADSKESVNGNTST